MPEVLHFTEFLKVVIYKIHVPDVSAEKLEYFLEVNI